MTPNIRQLMVLRVLAQAENPSTAREVASWTWGLLGVRLGHLGVATVRSALSRLGEDDLVRHVGYHGNAQTWAITPKGRALLKET